MEPICRRPDDRADHWRNVQADVCAVAADLIEYVPERVLTLADLRYVIRDFHDCHLMALVFQLACELRIQGHNRESVRAQLLAWDVADAMS